MNNQKYKWTAEDNLIAEAEQKISNILKSVTPLGSSFTLTDANLQLLMGSDAVRGIVAELGTALRKDVTASVDRRTYFVSLIAEKK